MNVAAYIGKPWRLGRAGPDAFDCWGMTRAAARELFGLDFPDLVDALARPRGRRVDVTTTDVPPGWRIAAEPRAGAVLALFAFTGQVVHCALCLDASQTLNTSRQFGGHIVSVRALSLMYPVARVYVWAP